tara:strand:+ start:141 stop:443 length:303 start_codon:yes stop_codon:yes gene_type:complete
MATNFVNSYIQQILSEQEGEEGVHSEENPLWIQNAKKRVPEDHDEAVSHMANHIDTIRTAFREYTADREAFGHLHGKDHPKIGELDAFLKHASNAYIDGF